MKEKYTIISKSGKLIIEAESRSEAAKQFVASVDFDNSTGFKVKAPYDGVGSSHKFVTAELLSEISDKSGTEKKSENTKDPNSTEQLLVNLLRGQQTQIDELKKLNFKLMMFWVFLVVLPLLGWLLTQ